MPKVTTCHDCRADVNPGMTMPNGRIRLCPLHAQAEAMRDLVRAMLVALDDAANGPLDDDCWNRGHHGYVVTSQARALLDTLTPTDGKE